MKNKKVLLCIALLFTGLTGCGRPVIKEEGTATYYRTATNITPQEAFALIEKNKINPNFVILDVSTPQEFVVEHLEGAINIDYYSKDFRRNLAKLDKENIYLIYCSRGGRSCFTLSIIFHLGFMESYNMLKGLSGWKKEGLPTIKQ